MTPQQRRNRESLAAGHMPLAMRRAGRIAAETGLPVDEARSAALLGLAEAIARYNPEVGEFAPFACRTIDGRVRAEARDWRWRRRANPQPGRELAGGDPGALIAMVPDTLSTAELVEARTDVARALLALTALERRVVLLHGKLGHTFPAIALMLDVPEEHAKYVWRRALERMRAALAPSEPESGQSPAIAA